MMIPKAPDSPVPGEQLVYSSRKYGGTGEKDTVRKLYMLPNGLMREEITEE